MAAICAWLESRICPMWRDTKPFSSWKCMKMIVCEPKQVWKQDQFLHWLFWGNNIFAQMVLYRNNDIPKNIFFFKILKKLQSCHRYLSVYCSILINIEKKSTKSGGPFVFLGKSLKNHYTTILYIDPKSMISKISGKTRKINANP